MTESVSCFWKCKEQNMIFSNSSRPLHDNCEINFVDSPVIHFDIIYVWYVMEIDINVRRVTLYQRIVWHILISSMLHSVTNLTLMSNNPIYISHTY